MADSSIMMALGAFYFEISTAAYDDLQRRTEYRWPTQDRIGVAPARQWVGKGDDTITLSGKIYPHFVLSRSGNEQVSRMREVASTGQPLRMVDGAGRVWGMYVITSITEGQSTFFSDGRPRCIEFTVELGAYGG